MLAHTLRVVMTTALSVSSRLWDGDACRINLLKPLSLATAIQILETPIRQPLADHLRCTMWNAQTRRVKGPVPRNLYLCCNANRTRTGIRPADSIRVIRLEKGAFLHHRRSIAHNTIKTDRTLWNTLVFPRINYPKPEGHVTQVEVSETTIALLHLSASANCKICSMYKRSGSP